MPDYPFVPARWAVHTSEASNQKPFAVLTFPNAELNLYLNGGEIYATVKGELGTWDLRNLKAMTDGLYPLYAGLQLESDYFDHIKNKTRLPSLPKLLEHLPLPVHHSRDETD